MKGKGIPTSERQPEGRAIGAPGCSSGLYREESLPVLDPTSSAMIIRFGMHRFLAVSFCVHEMEKTEILCSRSLF